MKCLENMLIKKNMLVKNMNKKADLPGWSYVVAFIISLFVIALVVYISLKSKGTILDLLKGF